MELNDDENSESQLTLTIKNDVREVSYTDVQIAW